MVGPREIVPGVYGLGTEKVNWYLVESGGELTAVDAGLPAFADTLEADLKQIGFTPGDVKALVLTHSDGDHTGLTRTLAGAGARVLIHEDDQDTLRKPRAKGGDGSPVNLLPYLIQPGLWSLFVHMGRRGGAKPLSFDGAETYTGGQRLNVPGSPLTIHTPGHTPGHNALLFEERGALFVGDALCTWNPVFGGTGPQLMPKAFNVSTSQCLHSLKAIEDLTADVVLPGHGEPWVGTPASAVAEARGRA
ncbi:MAG TPA: MBL fold metallo-hydrolase [Solirubrobacteraceae bacterium]|jgi:glyoxylase-like metal-dependent hydrolase (beta-lactamase superfamily II)